MKVAHKNIESGFNESELYQINSMILDDTKKNWNELSVRLNANLNIYTTLKDIKV